MASDESLPFVFKIVSSTVLSENNFECQLRANIRNEESFYTWLKRFSDSTKTKWILSSSVSQENSLYDKWISKLSVSQENSLYDFSRNYVCQHSSFNKISNKDVADQENENCQASLKIRIKRNTKFTRCTDPYVKEGLCAILYIKFKHSHDLNVVDAWDWLMKDVTGLSFIEYFNDENEPASNIDPCEILETTFNIPGEPTKVTHTPTVLSLSSSKSRSDVSTSETESPLLNNSLNEANDERNENEPTSNIDPCEILEETYNIPGDKHDSSNESSETETSSETDTPGQIGDINVQKALKEREKLETDLSLAYEELNSMREDIRRLQEKLSLCDPTKIILENKEQFEFYTGLPSIETFKQIIHSVENEIFGCKLPLESQFLIVLMKVKLKLQNTDIGYKFHIAHKTVQRILDTWAPVLQQKYGDLFPIPQTKKRRAPDELDKQEKLTKKKKFNDETLEKPDSEQSSEEEPNDDEEDSIQNLFARLC